MATNHTQKELKRQALKNLDASRAEIVAGIHQVRSEMSPKLIFHRLVDRHTGAVVCVAIAAGAASSLLIGRRARSPRLAPHLQTRIAGQSIRHPTIGSRVVRILSGILLPALLKSGVGSVLRNP